MLKLQAEFTNMLVFWQKLLNLRQGVQDITSINLYLFYLGAMEH